MKAIIKGPRVFFEDCDQYDIGWLRGRLTWQEKRTGEVTTFLFQDGDGRTWTFAGLAEPLRAERAFDLSEPAVEMRERPAVPLDLLEGVTLFPFQEAAVAKAIQRRKGIVEVPTGGGKGEIILAILRHLIDAGEVKRALVVVPAIPLAEELTDRARRRGFADGEVGAVYSSRRDFHCKVVVGVINSIAQGVASQKPEIIDLVKKADVVIFDECHHLRANTWIQVAERCESARFVLGFSGSPFHEEDVLENEGDALIQGLTGGPIVKIPISHLREIGLVAELTALFCQLSGPARMPAYPVNPLKNHMANIANNAERNGKIVSFAERFLDLGFPTLILVKYKAHALTLANLLSGRDHMVVFGNGEGFRARNGVLEAVDVDYAAFRRDFEAGTHTLAIATPIFDEGFDLPSVGAVIMGGAGRSRIKVTQRTGRGLRGKKDGPNRVYLVDFQDRAHVFLAAQFKRRRAIYQDLEATLVYDEAAFLAQVEAHSALLT